MNGPEHYAEAELTQAAQTSGAVETRGGSLDRATTSSQTAPNPPTGLVIVATHNDSDPMVVGGLAPGVIAHAGYLAAWSQSTGFTDVHFARETVTYERLTLTQAIEETTG